MKKLLLLALLAGCASTGQVEPDPCKEAGGVWYKGPNDADYYCVDKRSLEEELYRISRRIGR